jgi:nitroreductase
MQLIENLKWRYATKKYNNSKKVSSDNISKIMEAVNLSATSYGLQLYKVLNIESIEIREQLKAASWGQTQITDASHLFVFCNYAEVKDNDIDAYLQLKANTQKIEIGAIQGYGEFIKGKMKEKSTDEKQIWTAKQTYIALSNAISACAELKLDSTPIEGFEPETYNKILGLNKKGLMAAVVLAIGYRNEEDTTQHGIKVRKSIDKIFEIV